MSKPTQTRIWFTFDFELAWGVAENGLWKPRQSSGIYKDLHVQIDDLIALFTTHQIPVTWATVGAMVTEPGQWEFDHLPSGAKEYLSDFVNGAETDSLDGRNLFEKVARAGGEHTIACHSYSHLRFNYPDYDEDAVCADLQLARAALGEHGRHGNCLVLPQNIEHNMGALKRTGVSLCRTSPLDREGNRYLRKVANTLGCFTDAEIWLKDGITFNSGTLFFNAPRGSRNDTYFLWLLKRATRRAIARGEDLHFWAHPFNFTLNPGLFEVARQYFSWLDTLRKEGSVFCDHWDDSLTQNAVSADVGNLSAGGV